MFFLGVARVAKNPGEMYWISSPKGQTQLFDELSQDYDRQEMIILSTMIMFSILLLDVLNITIL